MNESEAACRSRTCINPYDNHHCNAGGKHLKSIATKMAPRARALAVANLVVRVVIATTARVDYDPIGEDVGQIYDISFQDLYTYR
jgi:hypothetical protein